MEDHALLARTTPAAQSAMNRVSTEAIERFCSQQGIPLPVETTPIRAGRNSEVLMVSGHGRRWVIKNYHQHASDKRERLKTEYGFLEFLHSSGIRAIAQPLGMDLTQQLALYSYLPGKRPVTITSNHILQAARFIGEINLRRGSEVALRLPVAADACLSWHEHFKLIRRRIERLLQINPETKQELEAWEFVSSKLSPLRQHLEDKVDQAIKPISTGVLFPQNERILSPSDFGFHNSLENADHLAFVDFEYAGWDDPAKLICDFICQPEIPVTADQGWEFMEELLAYLPSPAAVRLRVQHLLPLHRVKWCCILLNEFRTEDRSRRVHAGVETSCMLKEQMAKTKRYFNYHLAHLV